MKKPISINISCLPQSPLGPVWIAVSSKGIWALEFQVSQHNFIETAKTRGEILVSANSIGTSEAIEQVDQYLRGERRGFNLEIDWTGMSEFQILVRQAVMAIPPGETASYGEIAKRIGRPRASRAVGMANASNPIPLVIPCHRVIGKGGDLTGYGGAGGLKTKQWLLDLENGI